ncbi:MAG: 50S ribosomal protein L6 [Candidatus Dependentiae bacterium]|jgi:large subunit ribosomal protein L6
MSKIGRKPIDCAGVTVTVSGQSVSIKGKNAEFTHEVPAAVTVAVADNQVTVGVTENTRTNRMVWGLHRALIANKVKGAATGFEQLVKLVGLGYKGQLSGQKIVFSIGYSHKVEYQLPKGIAVDIDKTGQKIVVKGADKFVVGNVCDAIRSIRPPEPYKGTGIMLDGEVIIRKAGKTKA